MKNNPQIKTALVWVLIILVLITFVTFYQHNEISEKKYTYQQLVELIEKSDPNSPKIKEINIKSDPLNGDDIIARLIDTNTNKELSINVYIPPWDFKREEIIKKIEAKGITYSFTVAENNQHWLAILINLLPIALIIGFMYFAYRNMQGVGGKAMSFGKSNAKMMVENEVKITFKDVAGVEDAKQECEEIIAFLKDHRRFKDIGAKIPKGVLLIGAPGTGKTLLARAIAGEAGVPFFHMSGSDFVEMFVGVGASRVRDLFTNAKRYAPCIIFIDEIDAVGRHRGAGLGGGHDEREQTLNQLLVEMDGFESNEAIIVVAATNRPDVLDPALLRPGRFDRRVTVNLPDLRGRKEIANVYIQKVKSGADIDSEKIAIGTPGFSGADIANLVNEAALWAARHNRKFISMKDIEAAKDKILMGPERKNMIMNKDVLMATSYHETGHALAAYYLKARSKVHKFSIIPRGRALGVTIYLPNEDLYSYNKEDLLIEIAKAMGGRAAEDIKYSTFNTGASNDIKQATELARDMVCRYGMSVLGPINYGDKHDNPFLGRGDWSEGRSYSDKVAQEIDSQVRQIIETQYQLIKNTLNENFAVFEHVARVLFEVETLDAHEFVASIHGATIEDIKVMQKNAEKTNKNIETITANPSSWYLEGEYKELFETREHVNLEKKENEQPQEV